MSNPSGTASVYLGPSLRGREAWSFLKGHGVNALLLDQNMAEGRGLDEVEVIVPAAELEAALDLLRELGLAPEPT
ncbi:MAG: hypothetical protein ABL998_04835 [Planctomycetota bacterium]